MPRTEFEYRQQKMKITTFREVNSLLVEAVTRYSVVVQVVSISHASVGNSVLEEFLFVQEPEWVQQAASPTVPNGISLPTHTEKSSGSGLSCRECFFKEST